MSSTIKALCSPAGAVIELVKWKVRHGSKVDPGSVLMTYRIQGEAGIKKLKSQQIGSVLELLKAEGDIVQPSQQLLKLTGCSHNIVIKDMCAECGKDLREDGHQSAVPNLDARNTVMAKPKASVSMVHSVPELVVTDKHAEEIGKADLIRLRKNKKLVLLVDLDQTLIHTSTENVPSNLKGVHHFQLAGIWYHTKFRPGTEEFLQTISKYYELHIVTFGVRKYAHTIARLMDGEGKYFSHRILSRDELVDPNTKKANLKSLFPCGDDMVAIIDDREDVWNYSPNLVPVLPYKFFRGTGDINAPNKPPPSVSKSANESVDSGNQTANIAGEASTAKDKLIKDSNGVSNISSSMNSASPEGKKSTSVKRSADCIDSENTQQEKKFKDEEVENASQEHINKADIDVAVSNRAVNSLEKPSSSTSEESSTECSEAGTATEVNSTSKESKSDSSTDQSSIADSCAAEQTSAGDAATTESSTEQTSAGDAATTESSTEQTSAGDAATTESSTAGASKTDLPDTVSAESAKADSVPTKEEIEWPDEDTYLQRLTTILVDAHHEFYQREANPNICKNPSNEKSKSPVQTVASVLATNRKQVLEGCVLAFSGLFPQSISLYHSTAYSIATKLGAQVAINVEDNVTHLVASRLGTKKVRQAVTNGSCTIVHPDWLWLTWYNFLRENELKHILTKDNEIPEPKPGNGNMPLMCGNFDPSFGRKRKLPEAVTVNEEEIKRVMIADVESDYQEGCDDDTIIVERDDDVIEVGQPMRRFSDTYNPIMTFDNDELNAMDAEIEDAFGDNSSSEGSDEETSRDKELRKKVLSSDEHDSDSDESLSNDYPKGWGPKNKQRKSSPHESYDELQEEDYMHMQEAAENSPMEIHSSDSSDEDDAMAAALDSMLA